MDPKTQNRRGRKKEITKQRGSPVFFPKPHIRHTRRQCPSESSNLQIFKSPFLNSAMNSETPSPQPPLLICTDIHAQCDSPLIVSVTIAMTPHGTHRLYPLSLSPSPPCQCSARLLHPLSDTWQALMWSVFRAGRELAMLDSVASPKKWSGVLSFAWMDRWRRWGQPLMREETWRGGRGGRATSARQVAPGQREMCRISSPSVW